MHQPVGLKLANSTSKCIAISYTHIAEKERYIIYHLRFMGLGFREICRRLVRHHTTISGEVKRIAIRSWRALRRRYSYLGRDDETCPCCREAREPGWY
ncbi:MAG: helix-turn-helix domain-containing protein [Porticoccaceae bacterium]|nr:helix-turn-helix domain-containing protein [Porticoccaceae bacterium]